MLTVKEIERQILHFKQSIRLLKTNLEKLNYQFCTPTPLTYEIIKEPDPLLSKKISYLESKIGPLPLVLKCFYKHIGEVNFQGFHPDWEAYYADALWIDSIDAAIEEWEIQDLEEQENIFYYPVAPDFLHKENVSGGMFYHIELPNSDDNPIIIMEGAKSMTFLDYLSYSVKWGGFPGLACNPSHNWPLEKIKKGLKELRSDD